MAWFLGRALLTLPCAIEEHIEFLLPEHERWVLEAAYPHMGDVSICSDRFFNYILPCLADALVTDGICVIEEFPSHLTSKYSLQKMPNYRVWACAARSQAKAIEESRIPDEIQTFNQGSQAALASCHRRIDQLESLLQRTLSNVEGITAVETKLDNDIAHLVGRQQLVVPP
jgi:hypothetical protein